MTATRTLPETGGGDTVLPTIADSFKAISNYVAGNAVSPTGTNAYSFRLDVEAGLTAHPDGMRITIKIPNTNDGACTFEIRDLMLGTKAAVAQDGSAFIGGELKAGTSYTFVFHGGSDDEWRLQSPQSTSTDVIQSDKTVYTFVREFNTPGADTWTAPWRCNVRIWAIGGGGSGGRYNGGLASGGRAGGTCIKSIEIASGEVLTLDIGAGGAPITAVAGAGNDGTDTTVTGTSVNAAGDDLSLSAAGGDGGGFAVSGTAAGGTGGAASGGDFNFTGGGSGSASGSSKATGGGAVGLFQNGQSSADNSENGASLLSNGTPKAHYAGSNFGPLLVAGAKGGAAAGDGGNFCGGGAGTGPAGAGGIGAGGGGSRVASGGNSGAGGDGLIIIEYTTDLDA